MTYHTYTKNWPNDWISGASSGTVNTAGTAVTWVSGTVFNTGWAANTPIFINGVQYAIASVTSTTALTLTATAGTQTGVTYSVGTPIDAIELNTIETGMVNIYQDFTAHLSGTDHDARYPVLSGGKVPNSALNTGTGNALDADTVDGAHAGTSANNVLKLDGSGKVPNANLLTGTGNGIDADTVDGAHAGTASNNVLKLNSSGKVPNENLNTGTGNGIDADKIDGYHIVDIIPTGSLLVNAIVANPPAGWLLANGQNVSKTTYATLYTTVGANFCDPITLEWAGGGGDLPDARVLEWYDPGYPAWLTDGMQVNVGIGTGGSLATGFAVDTVYYVGHFLSPSVPRQWALYTTSGAAAAHTTTGIVGYNSTNYGNDMRIMPAGQFKVPTQALTIIKT